MSAKQIQKNIQRGMKRAHKKAGSPTSDKVYLVSKSTTSGTPLTPGVTTTSTIELTNALFINYDANMFDISILSGDRGLLCDNVNIIKQGDIITQGSITYYVVSIEIVAPYSDRLMSLPQLRIK